MHVPLLRLDTTALARLRRWGTCAGLLLCALAAPSWAQDLATPPATQPPAEAPDRSVDHPPAGPRPIGADTRALFEHQRQASAGRPAPGIPGPVAVETWERYLRSYRSEIPAQFDRQLKESVNR
nr:DUF3613 domain-containing protein [Aquabacterium sp. A08]